MLDKSKTDPKLGREIHQLLHDTGIETPMIDSTFQTESEKFTAIRDSFKTIMQTLGMDLTDDSLLETPNRIAKMYLNEIFWGLDYNNFPKVTTIDNKMQYNSMLLERNIKVSSFCEHHFVNFVGSAYVAYIPHGKIIGLSKINRIVEFFCRRPQVQERLCEQIWRLSAMYLKPKTLPFLFVRNISALSQEELRILIPIRLLPVWVVCSMTASKGTSFIRYSTLVYERIYSD